MGSTGTDTSTDDDLRAQLHQLQEEVRTLTRRLDGEGTPPAPAVAASVGPGPAATTDLVEERVDRRRLLCGGLAAAAGVAAAGAVLLDAAPAAAANGGPILMGRTDNSATLATGIGVQGTTAGYGFGVTDNGYGTALGLRPTILAHARNQNFDTGIQVIAEGTSKGIAVGAAEGIGVSVTSFGQAAIRGQGLGTSATGVGGYSPNGAGVTASSDSGTGIVAFSNTGGGAALFGSAYGLRIERSTTRQPPPQDAVLHQLGELVEDRNGDLWLSVGSGTPGTWRKVGGPATAGAFHALPALVRVYDSRPGSLPAVGPKTPLTTARTIDLTANASGVPAGATAVVANVSLFNATSGNGVLTVWSNGAPKPAANSLVWGGNAGRFSTLAVTTVDALARCQVDAGLPTDIAIDVVGYYR